MNFYGIEDVEVRSFTVWNRKIHIGDKLAYQGSLLSQELIVAYRWLAYRVAYRVVAVRRCGQRLGGGRRLGGAQNLIRDHIQDLPQAPRAFAYRSAGGSAAVGGSAAAAWQRRRLGVSSAFAYRLAYRSAYPGAYPCLSLVITTHKQYFSM